MFGCSEYILSTCDWRPHCNQIPLHSAVLPLLPLPRPLERPLTESSSDSSLIQASINGPIVYRNVRESVVLLHLPLRAQVHLRPSIKTPSRHRCRGCFTKHIRTAFLSGPYHPSESSIRTTLTGSRILRYLGEGFRSSG